MNNNNNKIPKHVYDVLDAPHLNNNETIYADFYTSLVSQEEICLNDTNITNITDINYDSMTYDNTNSMALHLYIQQTILEKYNKTLVFWNKSQVKLIFNRIYLITNLANIIDLSPPNYTHFKILYPTNYPYPPSTRAPEISKIPHIPFVVNRSASYYGIGMLCLYALYKNTNDANTLTTNVYIFTAQISTILNTIRNTPLYFFISRCLDPEPENRSCIFI